MSVTFTINLIPIKCNACGVFFAVDDDVLMAMWLDNRGWKCPNGCSRIWSMPKEKRTAENFPWRARTMYNLSVNVEDYEAKISALEAELRAERNKPAPAPPKQSRPRAKKRHACQHCSKTFSSKQYLKRHVAAKHGGS